MAYIGNTPALKYASFAVQHFTTSATTSYSLDNAVTNENGIALFINNVRQQPGGSYAYTATGTTLTLSAATTTSDTMYCVFIGKAVQTVNPPAGSVAASQLATDAVTTAKILDDNVTTAKILDNNVTLAKLDDGTQGDILYYGASGAPARLGFGTSGDFLKTQGTGANPVWDTGGGITGYDQWRTTTETTGAQSPVDNWARVADASFEKIGDGMTQSSGVFTFPDTGKWWIATFAMIGYNGDSRYNDWAIQHSGNSGVSWDVTIYCSQLVQQTNSSGGMGSMSGNQLMDITDVSVDRLRATFTPVDNSVTLIGAAGTTNVSLAFMRIGDT